MTHCYTFQFNLWFNYNRNLFFLILEFYVVWKNGVSVNHSFRFSSCYVLLLKITETHWITQWPGRNMDNKPELGVLVCCPCWTQTWTQTNIDVTRHEHHNEPTRTEWGRKVYIPRDRQTSLFYSILCLSLLSLAVNLSIELQQQQRTGARSPWLPPSLLLSVIAFDTGAMVRTSVSTNWTETDAHLVSVSPAR